MVLGVICVICKSVSHVEIERYTCTWYYSQGGILLFNAMHDGQEAEWCEEILLSEEISS